HSLTATDARDSDRSRFDTVVRSLLSFSSTLQQATLLGGAPPPLLVTFNLAFGFISSQPVTTVPHHGFAIIFTRALCLSQTKHPRVILIPSACQQRQVHHIQLGGQMAKSPGR